MALIQSDAKEDRPEPQDKADDPQSRVQRVRTTASHALENVEPPLE